MLKAPPVQTATATIETLCSRLQSASLLEDRRAAILGLRSFAKQYPATVASGSLRELITTLKKDGLGQTPDGRAAEDGSGDVDTIRLVLETLLMLFNPAEDSPETGEEIGLFMADEFSMRQENLSILLSLLDPTSPYADYYSRLYSVQILSAICAARPERLQECILSAPLGVSRIVGILDDGRDVVRNAGLLLLVDLTGGANEDLRKIVAFEDVFAKVFALIRLEGGLAEAGITAQDCLTVLANLVKGSASNQIIFRESDCISQVCQLLTQVFPADETESPFLQQSREKGGWGLLQLVRLFLVHGEQSTSQNQNAFFRAGAAQILLDLGFSSGLPTPIRTAALRCASGLIQDNQPLQEAFATLSIVVSSSDQQPTVSTAQSRSQTPAHTNGTRSSKGSTRPSKEHERHPIIEALLDMSLLQPQIALSHRAAGYNVIQAYLARHERIKAHFLQRAIAGHVERENAANVLTTILQPGADATALVFASWIVQDLVHDSPTAKLALSSVREGGEDEDEDVLTAIQSLASQLQSALQSTPIDEKGASALASLLITLLWEFAEGINDLLGEGSGLVQALIAATRTTANSLVAGLAAALLGTIYEFSTKDSPIPRRTLAPILLQRLGRSKYLDALLQLRCDPSVRDFGLSEDEDANGSLSSAFVDLFMTEYSRLRKAIDKDPGVEVLPASAAEAGVDRDVLDSLRQNVQAANEALSAAQAEALVASQTAQQEKLGMEKELQTLASEVERLRKINHAIQAGHEGEVSVLREAHTKQTQSLASQHQRSIAETKQKIEAQSRQVIEGKDNEIARLTSMQEQRLAEVGKIYEAEKVEHGNTKRQLQKAQRTREEGESRERDLREAVGVAERQHSELDSAQAALKLRVSELENMLRAETERSSTLAQEVETAVAQIQVLRQQYAELEERLKGKDDDLRALDAELENERKGFGELEAEVENAKTMQTELQEQLRITKDELERSDKDLEAARAKGQGSTSSVQESAKSGGKKNDRKLKDLETAKSQVEGQLADLRQKTATHQEQVDSLKVQLETALADAQAAIKSLEEARDGEKSAKDELDSMLLVMGDIESKRDEYKAKVKALGGSITEDEDDSDGEDEEGDEDEDENEGQDDVD